MRHLRNGTSDQNFKIPKTLFNTNYPPKPRKNHLRNHRRPLECGFSAIATYKTRIFSKSSHLPISALLWDECGHQGGTKTINSTVGLFRLAWGPFSASVRRILQIHYRNTERQEEYLGQCNTAQNCQNDPLLLENSVGNHCNSAKPP